MKYLVTYSTIDSENANFLWHSFILLSKVEEDKKIEVVDNWGFYGVPTTTRNSYLSQLKIALGADIDLSGNHGMLRHEELRFLDLGTSLHGVTFELTEQQFNELQQRCLTMEAEQKQAISEVVDTQNIKGTTDKYRMYPHEEYSRIIYELEKIKARQNNREPRLKPFELNLNLTLWGPAVKESHTCKSQVLQLLTGILSPEQINRLSVQGKHPTIPKYSGKLETIFLHSSGPLRQHQKRSGEIVYYRDLADKDKGVQLHWTLPPQEIEALDNSTIQLLSISNEYSDEAKKMVRQLQRLEWLFINAAIASEYKEYQDNMVKLLREHYEAFSVVSKPKSTSSATGWLGYGLSLLSLPRNEDEKLLLEKINRSKWLINSIYMALVDELTLDLSLKSDFEEAALEDSEEESNATEAIVSYLPLEDQKSLCNIIGRNYIEEWSSEYEDEESNDEGDRLLQEHYFSDNSTSLR